jgi:hypothetical protein
LPRKIFHAGHAAGAKKLQRNHGTCGNIAQPRIVIMQDMNEAKARNLIQ